VLCPHVSRMFCLSHTKSTLHLNLAAMYSVCHIIPTSHYTFYLFHVMSTHQCHVLALSYYAHDAVPSLSQFVAVSLPYFSSLTLCLHLPYFVLFQTCIKGKIFYHSMDSTNYVCLDLYVLKNFLPFQLHKFVNISYTCLSIHSLSNGLLPY